MTRAFTASVLSLSLVAGCKGSAQGPEPDDTMDPDDGSGGAGGRRTGGTGGAAGQGGGGTGGGQTGEMDGAAPAPDGATSSPLDAREGDGAAGDTGGGAADTAPPGDGGVSVGGPSRPCNFVFCEGFEDYADGAAPGMNVWVRQSQTLVVGSQRVARGQRALHVPDMVSGERFIRTNKPFPTLGNKMYGRLFVWIEKEPQEKPATVYHWTAAEASERTQGGGLVLRSVGGLMFNVGDNRLIFNIETHGNGETARTDGASRVMPRRWHCFEWLLDRQGNQFRFWWNGQERTGIAWPQPGRTPEAKYAFPEMKAFSIGWAEYQVTKTPWEIWMDELALHTDRIGCDN